MSNIIISAFADEYDDNFEAQLTALNGFGIGHIELRHINGKNVSALSEAEVNEAKAMMDSFGIKASAIGSPLGKVRLDEDLDAHIELAKRVFEATNILGAKYVRMFSLYAPEGGKITEMRSEVLDMLGRMLDAAREAGVVLCHENEALIYGDVPERCREIIDYFGGELKCVFDMGNFVLEGVDPYPAYELLKSDIAYFHIKDALREGAIVPPGKGDAQIKEILASHREYAADDFFVSIEPHLQLFTGLNALVGRSFDNPYKYENQKAAFRDAVEKFKELI